MTRIDCEVEIKCDGRCGTNTGYNLSGAFCTDDQDAIEFALTDGWSYEEEIDELFCPMCTAKRRLCGKGDEDA